MRIAIVFNENEDTLDASGLLHKLLSAQGITVDRVEGGKYMIVSATKDILGAEASFISLRKQRKSDGKLAEFDINLAKTFTGWEDDAGRNTGSRSFFKPSEQAELLENLVKKTVAANKDEVQPIFIKSKDQDINHLYDLALHFSLLNAFTVAGMVEFITPLHSTDKSEISALRDKCFWNGSLLFSQSVPVEEIDYYFGGEVTMYFAWMREFTNWLSVPAVAGIITLLHRRFSGYTVDNDPLGPFFSIIVVVWALAFVACWRREEARQAYSSGASFGREKVSKKVSLYLYTGGVLCKVECCKSQLSCPSIISYRITSISITPILISTHF